MDRERLERQFDFIKEIDKEKFIQRQTKLSDGVRLFLEQQQKTKMKDRMNPIAAMLGIAGCECEECED